MISISCVIPHYNDSDRIVRAIDSCLEQDHLDEIIVVDDASSSEHVAALDEIARRQKKIRLLKFAQNAGQAAARNAGAALAQSKLICFLDSDDEYLPDFFKTACGVFATEPDIASLKCALEVVYDDLSPVLPDKDPRFEAIYFCYPCNIVVRRDVFFLIGGFPIGDGFRGPGGGEDTALNLALARHFERYWLARPYCRYYWKAGSHLDKFVKRTKPAGNRWKFTSAYPDEASGVSIKCRKDFLVAVADRFKWSKAFGRYFVNKPD